MEGKLIKTDGSYCLTVIHERIGNMIIATDNKDLNKMLNYPYTISLKNCQAIANGYDLDEIRKLADEDFECELGDGPTNNESINSMLKKSNANGAEWGFQKALSILGDKKFSEEDVKFMFQLGFNLDNAISRNEYDAHIQSLQQTEWDCIVEMEQDYLKWKQSDIEDIKDCLVPKLDADGCLILKRI